MLSAAKGMGDGIHRCRGRFTRTNGTFRLRRMRVGQHQRPEDKYFHCGNTFSRRDCTALGLAIEVSVCACRLIR